MLSSPVRALHWYCATRVCVRGMLLMHSMKLTCVWRPGSVVPLVMFLTFNAALLSVPGPPGDPLAHLVVQGGPVLSAGVTVFSLLAIFTSFAGTSIGSLTWARLASRCA